MERKMLFLYNPMAGRGSLLPVLGDIINLFVKAGYRVEVYPTQEPKDAIQKASKVGDDVELIVCCGGDGTLDEVVTGLVQAEKKIPVGYIPVGTTNDFASSLGLHMDILEAAAEIVSGVPTPYDVGRFNKDVFVYVAAFGAFTGVTYQTSQDLKKLFGHMAYVLESIKSLADIKAYRMKLDVGEDGVYEDDFIYGMVTNSISVGGFKNITGKNVELDDGVFEYTFIRQPQNLIELQEIVGSLLTADDKTDLIISGKSDHVIVETAEEISWTLDGEYGGSPLFVRIDNIKHGIEIMRDPGEHLSQNVDS